MSQLRSNHTSVLEFPAALNTAAGPQYVLAFDEAHILHELKHSLPSQASLKDFILHNSLHAY